ncbi:MAG: hypothetical protein QNJ33_02450 [Crocosphaera sp.]|nr:hypothetical protein [Crocosphaera sp.]
MLDMKYGVNLTIPGGPQFSLSNQPLKSEVYQHFNLTLNAGNTSETITLSGIQESNLLVIKTKKMFATDSASTITYQIGSATALPLEAPLLMAGTWLRSLLEGTGELTIAFAFTPDGATEDYVTVEVIFGKPEATAPTT